MSAVSRGVALTVVNTVTNADCGNGFSTTRTWQASDACGKSATCSQTVQVTDQGPPVILSQPQDEVAVAGRTATLAVGVRSCPPLGYQWYFNQTHAVAGATNTTLVLSPVVSGQAGSYTVVIANGYGSVTSSSGGGDGRGAGDHFEQSDGCGGNQRGHGRADSARRW